MKNLILFFTLIAVLTSFTVSLNTIPNVEFNIQFLNHTTGTPTLSVNGTTVASSTAPHYWSAFVDGPVYSGVYNFVSNKCYSIKGIGGTQYLCITFAPNYNPLTDQPTVTYNVATKTFTATGGAHCTYKISKFVCCITKVDTTPR